MSIPKVHNSTREHRARSNVRNPRCSKKRQGELELTFENHSACYDDSPDDLLRHFLRDLRLMCQLIEEAGRYGASPMMEQEYRALRTSLANGYRLVKEECGIDLYPSTGFHGSSFEMNFSIYSLDGLVRGPGMRVVERMADIWRTAQSIKSTSDPSVRRKAHSHA